MTEMSTKKEGRWMVLLSAVVILLTVFSVLLFNFPPGMEPAAALLIISPFAMCIVVIEAMEILELSRKKE